jgi:hypothetical protein
MKTKLACGTLGAVLVALAAAGIAWAQDPENGQKCGTPSAIQAARVHPDESGRGPTVGIGGQGIAAASPLRPPVVELPTGSGRESPASPSTPGPQTVATGSTPPSPVPPPKVPGLPPAKAAEEDKRSRVEAIQATGEIPEERLLDVGVGVFDPGFDEDDRDRLAQKGMSPELRQAEARYVAFHLKKTMEGTGNWGVVRMLPGRAEGLDVLVSGRIVESNGKRLVLDVEAADATGRRWLQRRYKGEADVSAYRPDRVGPYEPFQEVYNRIANDFLAGRDELDPPQLLATRRAADLRFAAQLAPAAFGRYLKDGGSGRYTLVGLPAEGDPMIRRVSSIRERDQMLVDTLNDYYLSFYERMTSPYASWRQHSYDEQAALDKINRSSLLKKLLGGAAMLAGVVMSGSDSQGGRVGSEVAMIGGMTTLQAGFREAQEKGVHEAALKELAVSFDGEVTPLLVEVEGHQLRLTGSAEKQFTEWRELLHKVFSIETGVPGDPNAPAAPQPPSL